MNNKYRIKEVAIRVRSIQINRFIPIPLLLLLYAILLARPSFVVSSYNNNTSQEAISNGNSNKVITTTKNWIIPNDPDLGILKDHSGDFEIGQSETYIIDVINIGSDTITGPITVTDNLPIGLTPIDVDGQGWNPCDYTGQLLTCIYSNTAGLLSLDSLPTVNLTVMVDEQAAPEITNFAIVANDNDANSGNNIASDQTNIVSADLEVSKIVSPSVVIEGDIVTYKLSVVNNGPNATSGVVLTDTLPGGVTFGTAEASKGTYNFVTGLWSVGDLTNSEAVTLTMTATVDTGTKGLTIVNLTDGVSSDLYDYDASNNTGSASFRVASTVLTGLVTDSVTDQPIVSASLVITDSVNHVYTTTTSASGWYTFTDTTSAPLAAGDITVRTNKEGYELSTVTSILIEGLENRLDVQLDTTDLGISKADDGTTVIPGQIITYTIAITNSGSIIASSVVITDVMVSHLTYVTDTLGIDHSEPTTDTIVWTLDDSLGANEGTSFKVGMKVAYALPSPTTDITNTVEVRTASPEANLTNNFSQDVNTSTGTPNVSITNSVSPSQVRTGQSVTYKIRVSNTGSAPATDVKITDTFSIYLNLSSVKTTKGTATTNTTTRKVTVEVEVLKPDETVTVTVIGRVNTTATYNRFVSNIATLSYLFGGSTTTKNSNSVSFQLIVVSTLPGTGGIAPSNPFDPKSTELLWPALISSVLLGLLGLFTLAYSIKTRSKRSDWSSWYQKMGIFLFIVALIFGLAALGLRRLSTDESTGTLHYLTKYPISQKVAPRMPFESEPVRIPVLLLDATEDLPDYPIPTPMIVATPGNEEKQPDASPVEWIIIPELGVDTVVKYVPYDGLTWLIDGLKREVAWMGETSWPGLGGNVGLAGHVTIHDGGDGPFRHLNLLDVSDTINLYTQENIYTYLVREKRVVEETDISILESSEEPTLTLITCTDWDKTTRFYRKRLVVFSDLIGVKPLRIEARGN